MRALKTLALIVISTGLLAHPGLAARPTTSLKVEVVTSPDAAGAVNSVLISGPTEVLVVDAQFTRSGAEAVARAVKASGKRLAGIFITHAHPDHYLGTRMIAAGHEQVRIMATADVVAEMKASAAEVAAARKEMLGPEYPGDPLMPEAVTALSVDGQALKLLPGLAGDTHPITGVALPGEQVLIASDVIFSGVHLWTANSDTVSRTKWRSQLEALSAGGYTRVIPGHQVAGAPQDARAISFTRDYLTRFAQAVRSARDPEALIQTMMKSHGQAGGAIFLKIGAGAVKGQLEAQQ